MVRKISAIVCTLVLFCALCTTAQAATTYEVYENGSVSSTYLNYFRDIIYGQPHDCDYVVFRSGQNSYSMIVSEYMDYSGDNTFSCDDMEFYQLFRYYADGTNYNSNYRYEYSVSNGFTLNTGDAIIYSSLGTFPRLTDERSEAYDFLQTAILAIIFFTTVISRFFISSKRRSR